MVHFSGKTRKMNQLSSLCAPFARAKRAQRRISMRFRILCMVSNVFYVMIKI
ncbi:MAG: hypothetical protein U5L45_14880 [Saprospiraceae bacterium]|nr:hypothetical protein [Saprospiraceae bacterium]